MGLLRDYVFTQINLRLREPLPYGLMARHATVFGEPRTRSYFYERGTTWRAR